MEVFSSGVLGLSASPLLRFTRATRPATAAKGHLRARMILDFLCCRNQRYIRRATDQKCWCRWGVSSSSRDTIKFLLIFEKINFLYSEICHFPIGIPFKKLLLKNEWSPLKVHEERCSRSLLECPTNPQDSLQHLGCARKTAGSSARQMLLVGGRNVPAELVAGALVSSPPPLSFGPPMERFQGLAWYLALLRVIDLFSSSKFRQIYWFDNFVARKHFYSNFERYLACA